MSCFQLAEAGQRDLARYLCELLGEQEGWVCLGFIDGDPRKKGTRMREEWEYYRSGWLTTLIKRISELIERYGNVYISLCLYRSKKRSYETALKSRWIWTDDVGKLQTSFSMAVQTSNGNFQIYHRLDAPADASVRSELQRRARHAMHGDTSSADAIKMVRLPGGYNTKGGGCYPVTLALFGKESYTVEELRARWPNVRPRAADVMPDIDWSEVAGWQRQLDVHCQVVLGHRIPLRVRKHTQTWDVLTMQLKKLPPWVGIFKGDGTPNWSQMRAVVAAGLRATGYPDSFIAAFLIEECDYGRSTRGAGELEKDVARVIGLAHEKYPHIRVNVPRITTSKAAGDTAQGNTEPLEPSRNVAPTVDSIAEHRVTTASGGDSVARQSRVRQKLTAAMLLDWYRDNRIGDRVPYSQTDTARELSCGVATVRRRDAELIKAGYIQRVTFNRRQCSYVQLFSAFLDQPGSSSDHRDVLSTLPACRDGVDGEDSMGTRQKMDVLSPSLEL